MNTFSGGCVTCVSYLREQTVVLRLPNPRNENPVVLRSSIMEELPLMAT